LKPGSICRSHEGERLLLVEASAGGFEAARYPLDRPFRFANVAAEGLESIGEDEASARVLATRRRNEAAAGHARGKPSRPLRTAMVLCAGLGTRLRPLTLDYPKPAVPFFGAPLVRYSFALLRQAGIERVVINTHHLPEIMERTAAAEAKRLGLELSVSHEPVIQGTAGGIRDASRFLRGEPIIVLNGDAFMSLDVADLVARHQERGAVATLAVVPMPPGESFGAVEADPSGAVRRIGKPGPESTGLRPWHFVGAHVLEPEVLDRIPGGGARDINREVYPELIADGRLVQACPVALGAWADMGTPRRYLQACEELMTGLCDLSGLGADAPIDPQQARALRAAGIEGRVLVDRSAKVDPTAHIERSQIGPGATIGAGALVRRSAILPGTAVAAGEVVEDAIASGTLRLAGG
jgi:mannose-1-phosphate guanylyltransferase